jgi:hypothetical protein
MLKLAGEGISAELIERLAYQPGLQDSGDLEAGTNAITATVEATGIGNADYSAAMTLASPSDARIVVSRIAARLAVTIDSMTAGQLNCRVYVDVQDAAHRLLDLSWTTTGAKLAAADTHSGNLATIFGLLKDGASHTFYYFFWVDTGNAVISLCQLWEGVGTSDTGFWGVDIIELTHTGFVSAATRIALQGTGASTQTLMDGVFSQTNFIRPATTATILGYAETLCLARTGVTMLLKGSVATDLNYLYGCEFALRSEQ